MMLPEWQTMRTFALLIFANIIIGTFGACPQNRFIVDREHGETGRYMARTNSGGCYICHYFSTKKETTAGSRSNSCINQNKDHRSQVEMNNSLYPYMYPGAGDTPACTPLLKFENGYWHCPENVFAEAVEVYAKCEARCYKGFHLQEPVIMRCPESLNWSHISTPVCNGDQSKIDQICSINDVNTTSESPFTITLTWHLTPLCVKQQQKMKIILLNKNQTIVRNILSDVKRFTFNGLLPDMKYTLSIATNTGRMEPITISTVPLVTPEKPHVHVHKFNSSVISVNWTTPGNVFGVIGYLLMVQCEHGFFLNRNVSESEKVIGGLEAGMNYSIVVQAYTKYTAGYKSDPVYVSTYNAVTPEKPHVHVHKFNSSVISVNWTTPGNVFGVIGYLLMVQCEHGLFLNQNVSESEKVVGGLEAGMNYSIVVQAYTKYTAGYKSDPVYVSTYNADPKDEERNKGGIGGSNIVEIVGGVAGGVLLCVIIGMAVFCKMRKKNTSEYLEVEVKDDENQRVSKQQSSEEQIRENVTHELSELDSEINPESVQESCQEYMYEIAVNSALEGDIDVGLNLSSQGSPFLSVTEKLDPKSLEISRKLSLDLEEVESLSLDSFKNVKDSNGSPDSDIGSFPSENTGLSSLLPEINKIKVNKRSRVPVSGHDSGVETASSSNNSGKGCTKSEVAAAVEIRLQELVEEPGIGSNKPDACCSTVGHFVENSSYTFIEDLSDYIDPSIFDGFEKSWKGLSKNVLFIEDFKLRAIEARNKDSKPFRNEIVELMSAQGKKIGHIVEYFSRESSFRKDVLQHIQKYHTDCSYCSSVFSLHL